MKWFIDPCRICVEARGERCKCGSVICAQCKKSHDCDALLVSNTLRGRDDPKTTVEYMAEQAERNLKLIDLLKKNGLFGYNTTGKSLTPGTPVFWDGNQALKSP